MNKFKVGDRVYPDGSFHIPGTIIKIVAQDYCRVKWADFSGIFTYHIRYLGLIKDGLGNMSVRIISQELHTEIINTSNEITLWCDDFKDKIRDRMGHQ